VLEFTRTVSGGSLWAEVDLDGETYLGVATARSGRLASGFGDSLAGGGDLDLTFRYEAGAAPGPDDGAWIDDVDLHCTAQVGEADGYAYLQGTSMATPHVTGAAALLFSIKPSASVTEVRQALLGSVDPLPSLAGKTSSGGRLDVSAAVGLMDSVPPPPPVLAGLSPVGGDKLRLIGSAQRGTRIDVYPNATCTGSPVAGGTSLQLAAAGVAVTGPGDTSVTFAAKTTDFAPLTSPCSAPISFSPAKGIPDPGGGREIDPGVPSGGPAAAPAPTGGPNESSPRPAAMCVVPRLRGLTLARAKKALKRTACKLAKVRKAAPRKGRRARPLVVKSSTPAAGIKSASGAVSLVLGPKPLKGRRR
jgi:subtilisin family serine protease